MKLTKELVEWLESRSRTCKNLAGDPGIPAFKSEAHAEDAEMFNAAARRLAVLEEEVEAARNILTDAALLTPAYNAERRALAAGSAMPGDYSAMDGYTEARAATDKERANG